jgi:hypothetical protein
VSDWEGLGGHILMGEGGWGEGGTRAVDIAEIMPQFTRRPRDERVRIDVLRRQVSRPSARLEVIDFLARRATTSGRGG